MLHTKHSGKAYLIMVLTQFILSYIVLLAFNNTLNDASIVVLYVCNSTSMVAGAAISTLGTKYNPFKNRIKASRAQFCLTAAIVAGTMLIGLALSNFFVFAVQATGYEYSGASLDYTTTYGIIMSIITMCIIAPVCEEILMRGTILDGLKESGERKAVLLTGLLFMLMHESPMQTVHQFILGVVLAYIVIVTRSFVLAIFGHALNNVITLGMVIIEANFTTGGASDTVVMDVTTVFVLTSLLIVGCVIVYFAMRGLLTATAKRNSGENAVNVPRKPTKWLNEEFLTLYTGRKEEKKPLDMLVYSAVSIGVLLWIVSLVTGY